MKKSFIINTNRADLLRFKDTAIMVSKTFVVKFEIKFVKHYCVIRQLNWWKGILDLWQ